MSKESRIDEQIKHFYDNVPNVGDALPLKDYLLKHEDSRMAWYLLGKEYEGKGDTAKATYCFAQAGEVYEAFESKPAPQLPGEKTKGKGSKWKWVLALLIPLLLAGAAILAVKALIPSEDIASSTPEEATPYYEDTTPVSDAPKASATGSQSSALPAGIIPPDQVAGAAIPDEEGHNVLGSLLTLKPSKQPRLLVELPKLGKWNDWVKSGKPIASIVSDKESGTAGIQWYDPKWCNCKPDDSSILRKTVERWKPMQEEKALLRSAMMRYKENTGSWPASPETLAADYPNNTMAGWNESMTPWFEELKAVLLNKRDGKIPTSTSWPDNTGPEAGHGTPSGQLTPLADQPLTVVIDKTNHRLAVVSGNVLIRNYEVGLGGDKTPEGQFLISEKVKNPNGSGTGAFGSRGMTLSDTRYGIHGTNEPKSIGKDESHGCVRMKKEDIEELYDLVPMGTPVTITKGGLPNELRAPPERFRLKSTQDETNPRKVYDWLN
ncbi:L,D-transpeptidase [Cohnella endophytica]|uniref:L,D-transpeptidase n=1 Tax=Cohnella endophytica TaxID=2419778 RepID=A0A494XUS2_9BACL|nr:L,D-transpeptidase [Cohnella endophytica]RKP54320.1 L,D-transpeptidase [Cohnella endophytica]